MSKANTPCTRWEYERRITDLEERLEAALAGESAALCECEEHTEEMRQIAETLCYGVRAGIALATSKELYDDVVRERDNLRRRVERVEAALAECKHFGWKTGLEMALRILRGEEE